MYLCLNFVCVMEDFEHMLFCKHVLWRKYTECAVKLESAQSGDFEKASKGSGVHRTGTILEGKFGILIEGDDCCALMCIIANKHAIY